MTLDSIVNVNITLQTQTVTQAGFGTPMILGTNKRWNDLIRSYANMTAVAADFQPEDPEYQAAQAVFAQQPAVPLLYIGRRQADVATVNVITAQSGAVYTVTVNNYPVNVNSSTLPLISTITLGAAVSSGNYLLATVNGVTAGTIMSLITFSGDFTTGTTAITPTVNGVALTPTAWTTDQTDTINAVASVIAAATGGGTAVASGDTILVTFGAAGANTVNGVTIAGSGSQPTVLSINQGSQVYTTSAQDTMDAIVTDITSVLPVGASITLGGSPYTLITINSTQSAPAVVTFAISGGTVPSVSVVNNDQPSAAQIATALAAALTTAFEGDHIPATASASTNTVVLTSSPSGTAYTLSVTTALNTPSLPNQGLLTVEQASPGQNYTFQLPGLLVNYTATNLDTLETITTALTNMINNASPPITVTATNNGTSITITSKTDTTYFSLQVLTLELLTWQTGMTISPLVATDSIATTLSNIQLVNDSWYALAVIDRVVTNVLAAATWIETQSKIFITASGDPNIINVPVGTDTTSIAARLNNTGYTRTACIYNVDAGNNSSVGESYPDCAWLGKVLTTTPGGETWAFKTLATIGYSDLTLTQIMNAQNKKCNTFLYIGGVGITQNGTMAVGEYIDIIRGLDWLTSTIMQNVYSVLVNNPKVPYTDAGITAVEAQIQNALQQGVDNLFLTNDPAFNVIVPLAANCSRSDKAARQLTGVSFTATVAGAIQMVTINGTLSL